jgi:hypothetical protein
MRHATRSHRPKGLPHAEIKARLAAGEHPLDLAIAYGCTLNSIYRAPVIANRRLKPPVDLEVNAWL